MAREVLKGASDMSLQPPSRLRDLVGVLLLLVPTVGLLWTQLQVPIDIENKALKSPGSPEALALERRIEHFGRDITLLAAFHAVPEGSGVITEVEERGLASLERGLAELEGVGSVRRWPLDSHDCRVLAVALDAPGGDFAPVVERVERAIAEGAPASTRISLTGLPVGEVVIAREVRAEQGRILPLVVGAFVLLLLFYYRHPGLVLAILAPAGVSIAWTGGIAALLGRELDPVSVMLQPVLLTVGVAAGVHWIEAYLDELRRGTPAERAAGLAVAGLRKPALLAALTTVVGFLSLSFNSIPAVIDFGIFAALGVALAYAIAAWLTPALLRLGARHIPAGLVRRHGERFGELGYRAAEWLGRRALAIRACAVLIAVAGLALWPRIEVDNDPQSLLQQSHPFRRATERVVREIGGSDVFDVLVPAGSTLAEPAALGLFAAHVLELAPVAAGAGPAQRSDGGDWLLRFLLEPSGSTERSRLFDEIEAHAAALGSPQVRATGTSVQVARDSDRLVKSAIVGMLASLGVLFVLFWAGFRSLRYAWLAMIPNALPCIVVYAVLAALGRPLTVATAMISSVLLGLIVDDTIHLLHRYRELRRAGLEGLSAIERVFQHSGRAIVITSVVLGLGFSVGLAGELATTVEFCGLAAVTILVAFLCDLLLLPAILVDTTPSEGAHG
jgi:predicted RND superfamily exporter protein